MYRPPARLGCPHSTGSAQPQYPVARPNTQSNFAEDEGIGFRCTPNWGVQTDDGNSAATLHE